MTMAFGTVCAPNAFFAARSQPSEHAGQSVVEFAQDVVTRMNSYR